MRPKISPLIYLLLATVVGSTPAQVNSSAHWKFQKDQDNRCVAKHISLKGIELTTQKLTIATKETSDLKTFEVLVNDKIVVPMGRASLTDASCKCIRIRNAEVLNLENIDIRVRGQTKSDTPIDTHISIQQTSTVMQALKSDICNKTQK